jgi:serine/threonine protein phosphatase PrpC
MRHRGRFRHDAAVIGCYAPVMDSPPLIEVNAFTHEGRRRANNEDSITVGGWVSDVAMSGPRRSRHELTAPFLVAVADGMGGHAAGEVASRYTIKRLAAESLAGERDVAATLIAINAELYQTMAAEPDYRGMGTTAVGLLLTPSQAIWFNLGDSRIYRLAGGRVEHAVIGEERFERHVGGRLEQLSVDDVPPGPRSGTITQCLGGAPAFTRVLPHTGVQALSVPSRWLVCSDGLTDMVPDEVIEAMMEAGDEEAVRRLFTVAMEAGGDDNVSIIVVSVTPANP